MAEPKKRNQYEFDKKKYDHIHLQVPKGKKEKIQEFAKSKGKSVNNFVNEAIDASMEKKEG